MICFIVQSYSYSTITVLVAFNNRYFPRILWRPGGRNIILKKLQLNEALYASCGTKHSPADFFAGRGTAHSIAG